MKQQIIQRLDEARLFLNKINDLRANIAEGQIRLSEWGKNTYGYEGLDSARAKKLMLLRQELRRERLNEMEVEFEKMDVGLPRPFIEQYTKEANFTDAVEGEPPGA